MHTLEKDILAFIRDEELITTQDGTVVVAVSGGPDSICLLHLLARLAEQLHITLVAAYVNHGLRPNETDREQQLVRDTAEKLHCPYEQGTVDVPGYAANQHLSIEHAARILRYNFLETVAEKYGADKVALAHTADDQAEELLLRLIRGTGRTGLAGMEAMRQNKFIRPLLSTSKSLLFDYLQQNRIAYALDSSNNQHVFLRNRIRLVLLPYIEKNFNPNIRQNLLQTANILRDEEKLLEMMTKKAWLDIFLEQDLVESRETPAAGNKEESEAAVVITPELTLDLNRFCLHPKAIQRRVLEKVCWLMNNRPYFKQIESLLQLTQNRDSNGAVHLADGLRVRKFENHLLFSYPAGRVARRGDLTENRDHKSHFEYTISSPGRWRLDHFGLTVTISFLDRTAAEPTETGENSEHLDLDQITFPLTIRAPLPKDRFVPLGSSGSKKLSRFLIDQKVKKQQRQDIPVLVSGNTIIALLGLRIDHRFRITPTTKRVMRIEWQQE
jgi:tRNA(Ile)-lysidine synthase